MKKSCFIKFIIIFTILLATVIYLFENKFSDIIIPGTENLVKPILLEELNDKLQALTPSTNKEELKKLLNENADKIINLDALENKQMENILSAIEIVVEDNIIDDTELNYLKNLFEKVKN